MKFPMFMVCTERAFVNVLLVYIVLINQRACFGTVIVVRRDYYLRHVQLSTILHKNEAKTRQIT